MGNYDKIKRAKYFARLISLGCIKATRSVQIKTDKSSFKKFVKNNKKLKYPYIILSTYGSKIDPLIMQRNLHYGSTYHVFNSNNGSKDYPILKHMGRRYFNLYSDKVIRTIKEAIKRKLNVVIYPEKYVSLDGTTSQISPSIIHILKEVDRPVMVCVNHGTYNYAPVWRKAYKTGVVTSEMKELFTREDLANSDEEELYNRLIRAMYYNECAWLKKQNIVNIDKTRCEGLENILYKCPGCLEENKMLAKGTKIHCLSCGKQWVMTQYGDMIATLDENENATLHNWFKFQKDCVVEEISNRKYSFAGRVKVTVVNKDNYNIVDDKRASTVVGVMWHNCEGIVLKYNLGSKEEELIINADKLNSIQINYDYNDKDTCIEIPIDDTIIKVRFNKDEISASKIMFVHEELYRKYRTLKKEDKLSVYKNDSTAITVNVEELLHGEEELESIIENAGNVVAVEYVDDKEVTTSTADKIRQSAQTAHTDEV
ncbi:MAG: hypothetical protein E7262_01815 [Lachnospiraceae bacterium]|nr:hypothetical protein [Lachnospiraceae bacterium]